MKKAAPLGVHFQFLWDNPPAPFNPDYDPKADARFHQVTQSLEAEGWYASHTREECKAEWGLRYKLLSQHKK